MVMLNIANDPVPLYLAEEGRAVRVTGTRIPIQRIVFMYNRGETPEEMVASFPTLQLADVHGVICYYLHHRDEVDAYVAEIEREEDELRAESKRRHPTDDLKARMEARWAELHDPARGR